MLNVFQIADAVDSVTLRGEQIMQTFLKNIKNEHAFFNEKLTNKPLQNINTTGIENSKAPAKPIVFSKLPILEQKQAISMAQTKLRRKKQAIENQGEFFKAMDKDLDGYWIEFHRKFALTYAIIVLFFIGAPLGAIVRRGGFGAPVVIAALLFMIYFVLISIGENLAKTDVVSPFVGMWFAAIVLTPIAIFLTWAASYDVDLTEKLAVWNKMSSFVKKPKS
jgi:lipopolysaccharide export system permease protein